MNKNSAGFANRENGIKELCQKLAAKWYYFLITLLIFIPLSYAYIYWADTTYLIRASILLKGESKSGLNSEEFLKGMNLMASHTELEDEIGILKSYHLSASTIRKLDFGITYYAKSNFRSVECYGKNYPFKIELDSSRDQAIDVPVFVDLLSDNTYSLRASADGISTYNFYTNNSDEHLRGIKIDATRLTGENYMGDNLSFNIQFDRSFYNADTEYYFVIHNLNSLADWYSEELDIKPVSRASNLVEVNLSAGNPEKAVLFINTLLDVYRTNELNKKNQLGLKTIRFIDNQLGGVSDELHQVESSLESFRSRNNILDVTTTAGNLTKNLDKLDRDKSLLEQKLNYYKYIAISLQKENALKGIGTPSTFGFEDPLLNNLLMELTKLSQERIGLNYSTKEVNPATELLELKIANAKKTLVDNVDNFIEASGQALNDLKGKINIVKVNVQDLPRSERALVSIKRRFDFNDNVYNYLQKKRAEAGIAIASNTAAKTIVDKARQVGSGPITPDKNLILLVTVLFAIAFSVGLIVFNSVINDTIVTLKDVERNSTIPVIGTISHGSKSEKASFIVAQGRTLIAESFRSLRVNLQYLTLGNENNVIGVTSSVESEGKTFCSVNLAVAMAQPGKKTIIIDADMRRPKISALFKLKNEKGLSSYLIGSCSLKEIINVTTTNGLDVITSGPIPPNPLDLIGLSRMDELINNLKQIYTTIIIDSPPIGFVSEYIILMKYTNANIYVVRSGRTTPSHLERINRLYQDEKIKNVSILLNDFKSPSKGYNYTENNK